MLKRILFATLSIAAVVALGFGGAWIYGQLAAPALAQTAQTPATGNDSAHIITVVGQGTVHVQPNIAQITVGVDTLSATVSEAVQANETQMKAIMAALKTQGIADKDIRTTNYSISLDQSVKPVAQIAPEQSGSSGSTAQQYRVSNTVYITIRNLDTVGDVLDAVVAAGANNVWGVSFSLDEPQTLQAQADARTKAVADAQSRAQALAGLGKVTLGSIASMSEVSTGGYVPSVMMAERAAGAGPSISPGELDVSYQVQVSYYIGG